MTPLCAGGTTVGLSCWTFSIWSPRVHSRRSRTLQFADELAEVRKLAPDPAQRIPCKSSAAKICQQFNRPPTKSQRCSTPKRSTLCGVQNAVQNGTARSTVLTSRNTGVRMQLAGARRARGRTFWCWMNSTRSSRAPRRPASSRSRIYEGRAFLLLLFFLLVERKEVQERPVSPEECKWKCKALVQGAIAKKTTRLCTCTTEWPPV